MLKIKKNGKAKLNDFDNIVTLSANYYTDSAHKVNKMLSKVFNEKDYIIIKYNWWNCSPHPYYVTLCHDEPCICAKQATILDVMFKPTNTCHFIKFKTNEHTLLYKTVFNHQT